MTPMTAQVEKDEGGARLRLTGEITESSDFSQLVGQLASPVAIDLSGIRRVNSCGVREWMGFVKEMERAGKSFSLERCSVPIVGQLNMIANFGGKAKVRSVYAPFFCGECNEQVSLLIELNGTKIPTQLVAQTPQCPSCGGPTEFDDLPESYFSFVGQTP